MTLPRNCSYTCPRMSAGSAEIDVADPGPDELGVTHDGPDDLRALLKIPGNAGQQGADPEQVERQSRDEQDDIDNSENDQSRHDLTFPSTRPRNRWCWRPSARTASTPVATCGISTVSEVFAAGALRPSPVRAIEDSQCSPSVPRNPARCSSPSFAAKSAGCPVTSAFADW